MPKKRTQDQKQKQKKDQQKQHTYDQLRGVMNMGREAEESMEQGLALTVLVDESCPRWLATAVRDALVPERDAIVDVRRLTSTPNFVGFDVGIILCGSSADLIRDAIRTFAGARQHVIVVAESALDIPQTLMPSKLGQFVRSVVAAVDAHMRERLSSALLAATDKDVALAANFDFCRGDATAHLVSKCAARNAMMGVFDFIPGAGMPLMTMNQMNLAFDIAATYGQGLSIARVPEVIFVVAAGVCYRGVARVLSSALPSLGLVFRLGVAYGGTLVTGRTLATHFKVGLPETGATEPPLMAEAQVL